MADVRPIRRHPSRRRARAWCRAAARWLWLVPACLALSVAQAQDRVYDDREVKAAFLYHFATFVEWPPEAQDRKDFRIAILGADAVAEELERFLPGRDLEGRPMRVERLAGIEALGDADMLFIGAEHNERLPDLIEAIEKRPILVVTEAPDALATGSMINFEVVEDRVRFEIALGSARKAGLDMSSRLLAAARFVDTTSALPLLPRAIYAARSSAAARAARVLRA